MAAWQLGLLLFWFTVTAVRSASRLSKGENPHLHDQKSPFLWHSNVGK